MKSINIKIEHMTQLRFAGWIPVVGALLVGRRKNFNPSSRSESWYIWHLTWGAFLFLADMAALGWALAGLFR
jgi:hypothetical protein